MAKAETRNRILEAGETLFSKAGYEAVTTKSIAIEASVTEMTLFNHFQTKKELYRTIVKERFMKVEIESALSDLSYDNLEEDLVLVTKKMIENAYNNRNILLMRLRERENFLDEEVFVMENDPLIKQVLPVFKIYEKMGVINGSERLATTFMTSAKGLLHLCILDNKEKKEIERRMEEFVHVITYGML